MATFIKTGSVKMKITLKEEMKRRERELTPEQKEKSYYYSRYYFEETGDFTLTLDGDAPTLKWRDGKTKRLESQMSEVLHGVVRSAKICQQKEIERKNEQRKNLEAAIEVEKKKILSKRQQDLFESVEHLASNWRRVRKISDFLKFFESRLIADKERIDPEGAEARFVNWLRERINETDPLETGQMKALIEKFERLKNEPDEDESYEYDDLLWKLRFLDEGLDW